MPKKKRIVLTNIPARDHGNDLSPQSTDTAASSFHSSTPSSPGYGQEFTNVFVKNLPEVISDEEFSGIFAECGAISSLYVSRNEQSQCRGFGFINFETHEAALSAIQHDSLIPPTNIISSPTSNSRDFGTWQVT